MRNTFLALFAVSLGIAACADPREAQPLDTKPDEGMPATPAKNGKGAKTGTSTDDVIVSAEPETQGRQPQTTDPETKPEDRPEPQTVVRDCGIKTVPPGAGFAYFEDTTKPVKLGMAVITDKPISEIWASGTPKAHAAGADALLKQEGDDLASWDAFLGLRGQVSTQLPWAPNHDVRGETYRTVTVPTATHLTHSFAMVRHSDSFQLDPAGHAIDTPDDNGKYLSAIQGTNVFAYTLSITATNTCAVGALSDAVKKGVTMTDILAPENREAVQKLLARDNALLWMGVYSTRRDEEASSTLFQSKCRISDLAACQETLDALHAIAAKHEKDAQPTYENLITNKDPVWAVTDFATADTSALQ